MYYTMLVMVSHHQQQLLQQSICPTNKVYRGMLKPTSLESMLVQQELKKFTPLIKPRMLKRRYHKRGTVLVFLTTLKFRAMGPGMTPCWLERQFLGGGQVCGAPQLQTATYVANMGRFFNILDDGVFVAYKTCCEPELFPGARLISLPSETGGGKVNVFASGKCVCLGKRFKNRQDVYTVLLELLANLGVC